MIVDNRIGKIKTLGYVLLIFLLFSCSNDQKADQWHDKAIEKYLSGDYNGAIRDSNKAIELDPEFKEAYFRRGLAKEGLKDIKGAIADFSKAIAIDPDYAKAYFFRGVDKIDTGDRNGGCLDLSKAVELGRDSKSVYEFISKYCR